MKPFSILLFSVLLLACSISKSEKQVTPPVDPSKYLFSFVDSVWLYKGHPFKMQQPIDYYVNIFGPYDRGVPLLDSMYVWDKLGIEIAVLRHTDTTLEEPSHVADRLYVIFNYEYQDDVIDSTKADPQIERWSKEGAKKENDARPKPFFQGSINLGNVELHKGMHIDTLINRLDKRPEHYMFFRPTVLPHSYECNRREYRIPFNYYVHLSDSMIIEEFILDMSTPLID